MLNRETIAAIRKRQLDNICELRNRMGEIAVAVDPHHMLTVGEGTQWLSTWIGHCVRRNMMPANLRLLAVLDKFFAEGSVLYDRFCSLCIAGDLVSIVGDATAMPLRSKAFDLTVAPLMIDDCNNHWALICELYRCTRRGGLVMVSGHGIDLVGDLSHVPTLIGAHHANPCSLAGFESLVAQTDGRVIWRWSNEHTWARVVQKA